MEHVESHEAGVCEVRFACYLGIFGGLAFVCGVLLFFLCVILSPSELIVSISGHSFNGIRESFSWKALVSGAEDIRFLSALISFLLLV